MEDRGIVGEVRYPRQDHDQSQAARPLLDDVSIRLRGSTLQYPDERGARPPPLRLELCLAPLHGPERAVGGFEELEW